jgi:hypothetical protein
MLAAAAGLLLVTAGCIDPAAFKTAEQKPADTPPPAAAPPRGAPPAVAPGGAAPAAQPQGEHAIPDVESVIVDKKKALAENPGYVETENKINAGDPLSAASQSYFNLGSRAHLLNFKHNLDIYKAANERYPTYDEFIEMFRQFDIKFKMIKPWQVYAYDQTDGTVVILEDRAEKKRRYEAAGLEYKE